MDIGMEKGKNSFLVRDFIIGDVMIYVVLVVIVVLIIGTALITWNLTRSVLKSKHNKEMEQFAVKNRVKAEKKEEVIRNANKQKAQINTGDANTDFDNSLGVLHQLSNKRK